MKVKQHSGEIYRTNPTLGREMGWSAEKVTLETPTTFGVIRSYRVSASTTTELTDRPER